MSLTETGLVYAAKDLPVKPGGCRPIYGLITTEQGVLTLGELFTNHPAGEAWGDCVGFDAIQDGGTRRILRTYVNGKDIVYSVRLTYNIELHCTRSHSWWVTSCRYFSKNRYRILPMGKWVTTEELQVGDIIRIVPGIYSKTEHSQLSSIDIQNYSKQIKIGLIQRQPECMNPDIAWLIGYLYGKGRVSPKRCRIYFSDLCLENLLKAQSILHDQFGLEVRIRSVRTPLKINIVSRSLCGWLTANGLLGYIQDKHDIVPKAIRTSSYEDILAFLAGIIDSMGHVTNRGLSNVFAIYDTNVDFCRNLQDLALTVGIVLRRVSRRILKTDVNGRRVCRHDKRIWQLYLTTETIPNRFNTLRLHCLRIKRGNLSRPHLYWIHQSCSSATRILGCVVGIEQLDRMYTYDVEVDQSNWYYAGAVQSHNSIPS